MIDLYTGIAIAGASIVLGFVVATGQLKMWRRIVVLLGLALIGLAGYRAINSLSGQPKIMPKIDDRIKILGHAIDKPNNKIFIWMSPEMRLEPQTYEMPYSKKTEDLLNAMRARYKGKPFVADVKTTRDITKRFSQSATSITINDDIMRFPLKNDPYQHRYDGQ